MTAIEIEYDLEGFFHDVNEDFEKSSEKEVASGSGSRNLKLTKRKKYVIKKTKSRSKVNKRPLLSKLRNEKPMNDDGELKSTVQKYQKEVEVKYHLDSTEDTVKVILDLDLTSKNLIEEFEDFINNNYSNASKSSPKTSSTATELNNRSLHDNNSRRESSSHSRPREWTKQESELQERMAMSMSTWEEDMSNFPELRPETITGVTMISGEFHFILDWDGDRWKVKAEEAYRRIPMTCLKFYESLLVWKNT